MLETAPWIFLLFSNSLSTKIPYKSLACENILSHRITVSDTFTQFGLKGNISTTDMHTTIGRAIYQNPGHGPLNIARTYKVYSKYKTNISRRTTVIQKYLICNDTQFHTYLPICIISHDKTRFLIQIVIQNLVLQNIRDDFIKHLVAVWLTSLLDVAVGHCLDGDKVGLNVKNTYFTWRGALSKSNNDRKCMGDLYREKSQGVAFLLGLCNAPSILIESQSRFFRKR